MAPTPMRVAGLAVAVLALLIAGLWWNGRPGPQAERCFASLAQALAARSPGDFLFRVHPDYRFAGQWASWYPDGGEAGRERDLARTALFVLFQQYRDEPIRMDYKVLAVTPREDGTVEAKVDVGVVAGSRSLLGDSLVGHRFVLKRTSWLGRLEILGHDPFVIRP